MCATAIVSIDTAASITSVRRSAQKPAIVGRDTIVTKALAKISQPSLVALMPIVLVVMPVLANCVVLVALRPVIVSQLFIAITTAHNAILCPLALA